MQGRRAAFGKPMRQRGRKSVASPGSARIGHGLYYQGYRLYVSSRRTTERKRGGRCIGVSASGTTYKQRSKAPFSYVANGVPLHACSVRRTGHMQGGQAVRLQVDSHNKRKNRWFRPLEVAPTRKSHHVSRGLDRVVGVARRKLWPPRPSGTPRGWGSPDCGSRLAIGRGGGRTGPETQ